MGGKSMICISYVIRSGDTLYSLSRRFNVPLEAIIEVNPFVNVYNLQIGEVICIPAVIAQGGYNNFTTYLVQEGDTIGTILERSGANLADLMQLNDLNSVMIQPGTTLNIPIFDEGDEIIL
jgi:LysM repeat protein